MSEVKKIKPSLSKGTRDFLPGEVAKRNYIFDTIKTVFRKYGFEEIETPAIERLETLTGKYGEEGDKLLFKILNSGDYLKDVPKDELAAGNSQLATKYIAEKGLRYDLTVPLARYVVQHQDELAFPFKRFHIGPVWRADRPQKGRYQEFYQCDADVIGSTSLLNEVELTKIYVAVFQKLKMNVVVRVNNRKVLEALSFLFLRNAQDDVINNANSGEKFLDFITILDKLDKIGEEGVKKEFISKGYDSEKIDALHKFLWDVNRKRTPLERLSYFKEHMSFNAFTPVGSIKAGLDELDSVFKLLGETENVEFDLTLARGLNYYTGLIWEIQPAVDFLSVEQRIGSFGGGGRYDNLTEMFGGQNMSGVGISFGIERIYDVMEELNLFPETISQGVKVLFVPRDQSVEEFTFRQVQQLRDANIPAEIFLGNVKKQKQFPYAEQKNIAYLVEVGENEVQSGKFRLRNAKTRDTQNDITLPEIIQKLS